MRIQTLFLCVVILSLAACHKDPYLPKSTSYTLIDQRSTGLVGTVTFKERTDSVMITEVDIAVNNTVVNGIYDSHIHLGPPSHYRYAQYLFGQMQAVGSSINFRSSLPMPYDSAVVFDGTYVLHDMTGDTVLALCGIGKNK